MGLLSLRSPLASLHFSHPACILHVTSLSTSPLSCTYAPKYLYSDTFFRTVSCNCTLPSPPGSPFRLHSICSVLSLFILNPLLSRTFLTLQHLLHLLLRLCYQHHIICKQHAPR